MSRGGRLNQQDRYAIKDRLIKGRIFVPCCFCERSIPARYITLEHITPISRGGTWCPDNIALSCRTCNEVRGDEDFHSFRRKTRATLTP